MSDDKQGQPRLEVTGPGSAAIVRGEHRIELHGSMAARIIWWHAHMSTHGPDWAATYLAGVLDGLRYDLVAKTSELAKARG
ncbi:MAG TPA: hypothetical protein VF771_11560 [Longimicrobiaceae bacterium]